MLSSSVYQCPCTKSKRSASVVAVHKGTASFKDVVPRITANRREPSTKSDNVLARLTAAHEESLHVGQLNANVVRGREIVRAHIIEACACRHGSVRQRGRREIVDHPAVQCRAIQQDTDSAVQGVEAIVGCLGAIRARSALALRAGESKIHGHLAAMRYHAVPSLAIPTDLVDEDDVPRLAKEFTATAVAVTP